MQFFLKKYLRICFFALAPIFLISNANLDMGEKQVYSGTTEIFNHELYHTMSFATGVETSSDGTKFSILKLQVKDNNTTSEDSLEFIISKEKSLGEIGPGNYRIAKDKDGFLNYIDGVFGFLNSKDSGELPFFAQFGEIIITQSDDKLINGFLNIHLENTIGDAIAVKGNFIALP